MAFSNEQHRKRYAEDPEYRARKLAENKIWRTEHRAELIADWHEKWAADAKFRGRRQASARARLLKKYSLTTADYDRMEREQNGVCRICGRKTPRGRYLCVDHCHLRQKVRGLLCHPCNTGLGNFDDDAERMREGADYLDRANGVPLPPCRCRLPGDIPGVGCAARQQPVVRSIIVLRCEVGRFRLS
jgi:Recombination endonuclease VII